MLFRKTLTLSCILASVQGYNPLNQKLDFRLNRNVIKTLSVDKDGTSNIWAREPEMEVVGVDPPLSQSNKGQPNQNRADETFDAIPFKSLDMGLSNNAKKAWAVDRSGNIELQSMVPKEFVGEELFTPLDFRLNKNAINSWSVDKDGTSNIWARETQMIQEPEEKKLLEQGIKLEDFRLPSQTLDFNLSPNAKKGWSVDGAGNIELRSIVPKEVIAGETEKANLEALPKATAIDFSTPAKRKDTLPIKKLNFQLNELGKKNWLVDRNGNFELQAVAPKEVVEPRDKFLARAHSSMVKKSAYQRL